MTDVLCILQKVENTSPLERARARALTLSNVIVLQKLDVILEPLAQPELIPVASVPKSIDDG